jgi:spore coat polysaccharide biosynthesis protein SpsF
LPDNDVLCDYVSSLGIDVFRGPEDDVLGRFALLSAKHKPDIIVRITGDEPMIEPFIVDDVIKEHIKRKADYTSTKEYKDGTFIRPIPKGLDCEVFSNEVLKKIDAIAKTSYEREHVTPYIYTHPSEFSIYYYKPKKAFKEKPVMTIDSPEDFVFVKKIIEGIYIPGKPMKRGSILRFISKNKMAPPSKE